MKMIGLYIHIPFCKKKCNYCDFISYERFDHEIVQRYFSSLKRELIFYKQKNDFIIDTIYIGGGTPSIVDQRYIFELLEFIYLNFNIAPNCEITIEANPDSVDATKLKDYRSIGINRISVGVQSLNQDELSALGRVHSFSQAKSVIEELPKYFENFNIDLMIGIPYQTLSSFKKTLDEIIKYDVKHISIYSLKIEENTPFYINYDKIRRVLPSEDEEREIYWYAVERLKENNIYQYEISNFSKKGYECIHNLKYWECQEYIGIGCAAHSFFECYRYSNTSDLMNYINLIEKDCRTIDYKEYISKEEKIKEYIILGLRKTEGIELKKFEELFKVHLKSIYKEQLQKLLKHGLVELDSYLRLTQRGIDLANIVWQEFI